MKLCFACSHGGHLAESKLIADGLREKHEVFFIVTGDVPIGGEDRVYYVKRFLKTPLNIFSVVFQVLKILINERPDALISTGAEIAIPVFYLGKLFFRKPTIYVECSAQVVSPSRTGRLIYPVSDLFLVQWQTLLAHYGPKARYEGGFI